MSESATEPFSQEVLQVMSTLSKTGAFQQLSVLIREIVTTSLPPLQGFTHPPKEHLKAILASLVDEADSTRPAQFGPRSSGGQLQKREVKSVRSGQLKQSPLRKSPTGRSPTAGNSLQARSLEELYSLVSDTQSEFTHVIGSATFSKAQRMKSPEISPGPADYQSDRLSLREKSPRALIPQGGKRFDYIPDTCTPGPGRYYPMRRFLSK